MQFEGPIFNLNSKTTKSSKIVLCLFFFNSLATLNSAVCKKKHKMYVYLGLYYYFEVQSSDVGPTTVANSIGKSKFSAFLSELSSYQDKTCKFHHMICIDSLRGMEIKWGKYPRWTDSILQSSKRCRSAKIRFLILFQKYTCIHMFFIQKLSSFWARVRNQVKYF